MAQNSEQLPDDLARLVLEHIDSVPHMEALVLVWENQSRGWTESEIAERIYQPPEPTRNILRDLQRRELIVASEGRFGPSEQPATREVIAKITQLYRNNVYRVATLIHARAPRAVREFARAFDIRGKS